MAEKKSNKYKILKTTDGFFDGKTHIRKPRRVIVVDERDDSALAVVKVYSKKNKKNPIIIGNLVLYPKDHFSLTEKSVVGNQIYLGRKVNGQWKPIYIDNFIDTNDKVTKLEMSFINKGIVKNKKSGRTTKRKISRWKNHFK